MWSSSQFAPAVSGEIACGLMRAMLRPLECFIGWRYLKSGRSQRRISFMSLASIAGIALGVAALIVILSAMNGLEAESRARLLSLSEHMTVTAGDDTGEDLDTLIPRLAVVDGVAAVTPFTSIEVVLQSGTEVRPAIVRGIDPTAEGENSDLMRIVGADQLGELRAGSGRILLGRYLAGRLGVLPGDRIKLMVPDVSGGRISIRQASFTVAGSFAAGVEVHDENLALTHLADAGGLIGRDDAPAALALRLADPLEVAEIENAVRVVLGDGYRISTWALENRSLFQAMAIEKTMMTFLLMFIGGVAAFNVVASLMMIVNEKERDIAILRTLGLGPERVMRIFLIQGATIGIGGTVLGLIIGLALALNLETLLPWLERTLGFQIMPGDVFYVTEVPSELRTNDLIVIAVFALAIAVLATWYPSRRAAAVEPADVLRYE